MALQKDTITINIAKTTDQKDDDKITSPDQMAVIRDARFQKDLALLKRNGLISQGTAFQGDPGFINPVAFGSSGPPTKTMAHEDQLCLINNGNFFSQYEAQGSWIFRGTCLPISISLSRIDSAQIATYASSSNLRFADVASTGGLTVAVTTTVVYVMEQATGNIISKTSIAGSETADRVIAFPSGSMAIVSHDGAKIYFRNINVATGSLGTAATIVTVGGATVDSSVVTGSSSTVGEAAFILYRSGTVSKVNVVKADGTLPSVGTLSTGLNSNVATIMMAPLANPNKIYVSSVLNGLGVAEAYTLSSTFSSAIFSTAFGTTGTNSNQSITMGLSPINSADVYIFHDLLNASNNGSISDGDSVYITAINSGGTLGYSSVYGLGYNIASQCFVDTARKTIFLPIVYISPLQNTILLADMLEGRADKSTYIVGKTLYGLAAFPKVSSALLQQCAPLSGSSSTYRTANNGYLVDFNLAPANTAQSQYFAKTTHCSGGIIWAYDGLTVSEHNFFIAPENLTITGTASGGLLPAGSYQVTFVNRWTDRNGQVYRSAPAIAKTTTTTGTTGSVVYTIWVPPITNKTVTDVGFEVYITLANQTTFYLSNLGTWSASIASVTGTLSTVNSSNRQLYTTGGVLENATNIGACSAIWFFKERLVTNFGDDPQAVIYSKSTLPGEPVNFAAELNFRIDADVKAVTAGITMDDKMIVAKPDKVYVLSGDGANDLGQGDTFQPPMLVASDVGCAVPNSMVLYSNGVIFSSAKGLYNLSRGLSTSYIGSKVEDYNTFAVASGALMENFNEIRFSLKSSTTGLVYNYYFDRWDFFSNYQADSSAIWQNLFVLAQSSGKVKIEDTINFYDTDSGTQAYNVYVETPWLKLKGIQDFQRIYSLMFLGDYFTPCTMKVEISYNYISTIVDTFTFDSALAVADPPFQFQAFPTLQKCQSAKVAITITPGTGTQKGVTLNELGAVVGLKAGLNKIPASKRS